MSRSIIDTHFHIWDLGLRTTYKKTDGSFDWPDSSLKKIFRNFTSSESAAEHAGCGVEAAIFVQCLNNCPEEINWVEEQAKEFRVIKGIVGGIDLTQDPEQIKCQIKSSNLLVGVRHILDVESEDWLLREDVHRGLTVLQEEDLVFDCLVRPPILKHVAVIASKFPRLKLIIDHISKPFMSRGEEGGLSGWKEDMSRAAEHPNVYCKLSGMVTEVDPENHQTPWGPQTFKPYVEHCLKVFGSDRCMFGSDWPVCKLAGAELKQVVNVLDDVLDLCQVDPKDKNKIFRENSIKFYKLQL